MNAGKMANWDDLTGQGNGAQLMKSGNNLIVLTTLMTLGLITGCSGAISTPAEAIQSPAIAHTITPTKTHIPTATSTQGLSPTPYPPTSKVTAVEPTPTLWPVLGLPEIPDYKDLPKISGMKILYARDDDPGLYTANIDGTDEFKLPPWPKDQQDYLNTNLFRASPKGDKILYRLWNDMDVLNTAIWLMNPDGSEKQQFLKAPQKEWAIMDAVWAPDGSEIAYLRLYFEEEDGFLNFGKRQELWAITPDGKEERKITSDLPSFISGGGGEASYLQWMLNGYIYAVDEAGLLFAVNPINGMQYGLMRNVDPLGIASYISADGNLIVTNLAQLADSARQSNFPVIQVQGEVDSLAVGPDRASGYVENKYVDSKGGIWVTNLESGKETQISSDVSQDIIGYAPGGKYIGLDDLHRITVVDLLTNQKHEIVVKNPPEYDYSSIRFITWIPTP